MTALRRRMLEDMQLRGLSARTQEAYARAVRQLHHLRRSLRQHHNIRRALVKGMHVRFINHAPFRSSHHPTRAALALSLGIALAAVSSPARNSAALLVLDPSAEICSGWS
jgi:hypothetical protein